MHKVFISYHHANDQHYKEELIKLGKNFGVFIDKSVDSGDIDEHLNDESIRKIIRDDYLVDSTVTILLVGRETKRRKHVDWEIYSSMYDGSKNRKSGILVINLPSTECTAGTSAHGDKEKSLVYPDSDYTAWTELTSRIEYETVYPFMPDRIIDNLLEPKANISVVPWDRITPRTLEFLIDAAFSSRLSCEYNLSNKMRRHNS